MSGASRHDDVTVVITNYNYGRFVGEAVQSCLEQKGGPPHVIVVDDGSTEPGTDAALARLPETVTVIRQANAGLSGARNAGMARATTELLMVLDADDRLAPDALDACKRPLAQDAALGFAYGMTRFFGNWDGELALPPYDPYKLLYRHMIGSTALMRRQVWLDTGGFDPDFRGYEDWEFWVHALERGWRGVRVPETTLFYRRHGDTMLSGARREYRHWYRRLRHKHASLYRRSAELAREMRTSLPTRVIYRGFWGPRPIPARLELMLHARLWRTRNTRSASARSSGREQSQANSPQ